MPSQVTKSTKNYHKTKVTKFSKKHLLNVLWVVFARKSLRAGRGREQAIEEGSNSQRPSDLLFLPLQDLLRNGRVDNIRKGNLVKPNQTLVAAARRPPPTQLEVLTMTHIFNPSSIKTIHIANLPNPIQSTSSSSSSSLCIYKMDSKHLVSP
jgi:hypothetical protein